MLERMWSKGNTHPLMMGMETCSTTLESVWQFLRKLGINIPQDPAIPVLEYTQKCSIILQNHLYNSVQSSIICNSQNLETA